MLHKVFLQCQFGSPHPWSQQYFEHFLHLEKYGWFMKVFTPNPWKSRGNIEFIPMTVEEYDELLLERTGVKAGNFLTEKGVPSKLISDHYVAWGQVFQKYINDFDYWGITNWDVVFGRLDRFIPDSLLSQFDIWADEGNVGINGIFTLFRNSNEINNLFRQVPFWEKSFALHEPTAFDEVQMTVLIRQLAKNGKIALGHPPYGYFHSYDRLPHHRPEPSLAIEADGSLLEYFDDSVYFPNERGRFEKEILLFHFSRTKAWPTCLA